MADQIISRGVLNHMGAAIKFTFPRSGVFRFRKEDLGDYVELKTIGDHNHLMLAFASPERRVRRLRGWKSGA